MNNELNQDGSAWKIETVWVTRNAAGQIVQAVDMEAMRRIAQGVQDMAQAAQPRPDVEAIVTYCSRIETYDDDNFTPPPCVNELSLEQQEEVMDWLADILQYCSRTAIDMYLDETEPPDSIRIARPIEEWHEDYGDALWWTFPIEEAPYCGSPLDSDWPDYHTHWTPFTLPLPEPKGVLPHAQR
ncbi:hypothetical protein PA598K_01360 [Paenibacillus sp. 598K]|uniref:hypothetical protein n=1 Tax=Paenibacillus sp. 598K TaxID=1117987 RepID=UPI000FF9794B|nr:hypothetical protein [Paenibacillus sp. 598K]GBF73075.1 hypothetical protein PA598K_01360 [Paenibacillus sp. 598K]